MVSLFVRIETVPKGDNIRYIKIKNSWMVPQDYFLTLADKKRILRVTKCGIGKKKKKNLEF
jgi:hypothetical protein